MCGVSTLETVSEPMDSNTMKAIRVISSRYFFPTGNTLSLSSFMNDQWKPLSNVNSKISSRNTANRNAHCRPGTGSFKNTK